MICVGDTVKLFCRNKEYNKKKAFITHLKPLDNNSNSFKVGLNMNGIYIYIVVSKQRIYMALISSKVILIERVKQ